MRRWFTFTLVGLAAATACFGQPAPAPPILNKAFGAVSIGPGNTTTLTFNLNNPNAALALTGLAFTDVLPAGLVVATPNGFATTCGGAITAVAGSNSIALSGATLAAGASCAFRVNVTATGSPVGLLTNTTSTVTSVQALPGAAAVDRLYVGNPFQVSYFPNLNLGDSVINITNTGEVETLITRGANVGITAVAGAIDVDVYVFSPDEQMISCCCCPVTPNGLVSLSVRDDLISNTLTPAVPTSVVVKLVSSTPLAGACSTSGAIISQGALSPGLAAWGTKIHNFAGTLGGSEAPFAGATLSQGELNRLRNQCTFINANGSGFGICRSCKLGGLGGQGR